MKINKQAGFSSVLLAIIILIVLGAVIYFYPNQKNEIKTEESVLINDTQNASSTNSLPDSEFLKNFISDDYDAKILARGDINNDGYDDAIVQTTYCGASCSIYLTAVINVNNKEFKSVGDFGPAYIGYSAAKSGQPEIVIKDGIITFKGKGLGCYKPQLGDGGYCDEKEWNIVKTVTYKFDGNKIVQISVSKQSKIESFKKQPVRILSIKDLGNNTWSVDGDLLTYNPDWTPGGKGNLYLNQNPKIRTLIISQDTKVESCDRNGVIIPSTPNSLVSTLKKMLQEKNNFIVYVMDIDDNKITATYDNCSS